MILYGFEYKGEFIYSIDRHDFTMTDDGVAGIDGGQFNEYSRIIGSVACDKLMYVAVPYTYA